MRHDVDSALAFYAINDSSGDVAVDDELDLLADEDQEFCPGVQCGAGRVRWRPLRAPLSGL